MTYKDFSGEEGTRTIREILFYGIIDLTLNHLFSIIFIVIKYYNTFYLIIYLHSTIHSTDKCIFI